MKKIFTLFLIFSLLIIPTNVRANEELDSYQSNQNFDSNNSIDNEIIDVTFDDYKYSDYDFEKIDISDYDFEINESTKVIEYSITENHLDSIQQSNGVVLTTVTWINRTTYTVSVQVLNVGSGDLTNVKVNLLGYNSEGKKVATATASQSVLLAGKSFKENKTLTAAKSIEHQTTIYLNGVEYVSKVELLN